MLLPKRVRFRKQPGQDENHQTADSRRRLHPRDITDDCHLRGQPAKEDCTGSDGCETAAAEASEHRNGGNEKRASHNGQKNEARDEVTAEWTSFKPLCGDAFGACQTVPAASKGVQRAESEQASKGVANRCPTFFSAP